MKRTIAVYGGIIAAAFFAVQWLEYRYLLKLVSTELYVVIIAVCFTAMGIWAGSRLTGRGPAPVFEKNLAALKSLGISAREYDVLELLAHGQSNKEIARSLGISPNTVKTHVAHLYEKLGVQRRLQAVQKAKDLQLIC